MQSHNTINPEDKMKNSKLIALSKEYTSLLQAGNEDQAECIFREMGSINNISQVDSDNYLFDEVGKLTRELHNNINQFVNESKMQIVADEEMPDARQRLEYVVELTERSAHKTMSLIENSLLLVATLDKKIAVFKKEIDGKTYDEKLHKIIYEFLDFSSSLSINVIKDLNGIMLAQDYQDLTGQIIQKVSSLVQNVENNLIGLLKLTENNKTKDTTINDEKTHKKNGNGNGYGPVVPNISHGDVIQSQDEVDDLLSSLGF